MKCQRRSSARLFATTLSAVIVLAFSAPVVAEWSDDPAVNLALGEGPGEQVVAHIAAVADGSCYVGWYDQRSGNYGMALQYLSPTGTEQWPHNGLVVSDHPQNSWVMDWALAVTADGDAVVAFNDVRGGSSNLHIYRIAPNGTFLWGADGITLTANANFKGPPAVTAANDGDVVVAWLDSPDGGDAVLRMQRLTPDGTPRLAAGGVVVSDSGDLSPSGAVIIPTGTGDVIVAYVPTYSFMADRQIKAQRFDPDGQPVWPEALQVMDDATLPMGHYFQSLADGNGGAVIAWDVAEGMTFRVRVQHLTADGTELLPHNGMSVADDSFSQIAPSAAYDVANGEIYVLYRQMTPNQNQRGLHGQKIDAAGGLAWGPNGRQLLPVDSDFEEYITAVPATDGVLGFYTQAPANSFGEDRVFGLRLDTAGDFVWPEETVSVASTPSAKQDIVAVTGSDGIARAIWTDERGSSPDIYGQNLRPDGSLGNPTTAVRETTVPTLVTGVEVFPNPFNPHTNVGFTLARDCHVDAAIYDQAGRLVRRLATGSFVAGRHTLTWHGRDTAGQSLPSGVYLLHIVTDEVVTARRLTLVK